VYKFAAKIENEINIVDAVAQAVKALKLMMIYIPQCFI
jgi:hypothetical protein